jgi:hypothetical protein
VSELSDSAVPEPPLAGTEIENMLGALERQRAYLEWKCAGLDDASMRVTLGPSAVTLGGLLKHLAYMEDANFAWPGRARGVAPWNAGDWVADPDWVWRTAADDTPAQLFELWRGAVERSRAVVADLLAADDLGHQAWFVLPDGRAPSLRRQLIDMIEEYARHVGHADLIRESIDGLVGEDPRDAA